MRVLLLGGAGFMGSNFARHLVARREYEVAVYDKLTYAGSLKNLEGILNTVKFARGDIANEEFLTYIVSKHEPDAIVNFAAETHVDRSINEPSPFIRTNIFGTFTVLEVVRKREVPLFLHISTDEVYGDMAGGGYATEDSPLNPSSPYSASKASADLLIKAYGRTYGINYILVRPSNNYGPYQYPEKLIPRTIIRVLHGKPATIYGDGSQVRDWLYVKDFCQGLETILRKGGKREIYNICANQFAAVKEIVTKVVELMGKDPKEYIKHVKGRPGEDRRYAMRCDKIRSLGWEPRVGLEEGLKVTVDWYLRNREWWMNLLNSLYVMSDIPWVSE